jgi:hypothetical protein
MAWLRNNYEKLRALVNGEEEEEEQTLMQQLSQATTLTTFQRMTGFAVCFGVG